MRNQKLLRIISLMLAAVLSVAAFAACGPKDDPAGNTDGIPMPTEDIKIAEGGSTSFNVVRGEYAEAYEKTAAQSVLSHIKDNAKIEMSFSDDWVDESRGVVENECEILVGRTNREESIRVYQNLRADDYAVTVINKKVIIAALTEEKLNEAVAYFIEKLQVSEGAATFLAADAKHAAGTYSVESIKVNGNVLSKYKIIYKTGADDAVKDGAEMLAAALSDTFGYLLEVCNDNVAETQYEIVFGGTNRGDSEATFDQMGTKNYKVTVNENRIFIIPGANSATPEAAVNAFIGRLAELTVDGNADLTAENLNIFFESSDFLTKNITINGVSVSDYTIVYDAEDSLASTLAVRIQTAIDNVSGRRVKVASDNIGYSGGKEILLGFSDRMSANGPASDIGKATKALTYNNMLMYSEGDFFFLGGKSGNNIALMAAANRLINAINDVENAETHALTFEGKDPVKPQVTRYKIMTYNDGDNSWRNPSITYRANVIKEYDPDIIGMQEVERQHAQPANAIQMTSSYKKLLPAYDVVYFDHEQPIVTVPYGNAILYKKDKFELVDSGVQWLSDTPDVPNSMYDATDYIRTYVYAVLKDKTTGEEIVVVNTHVDYVKEANIPQMEALIKCTERFRGKPIVFTGDFNMNCFSDGFKMMENAGYLDSGRYFDPSDVGHIDFIFFDPSTVVATSYKCIDDNKHSVGKPQAGSDHNPYITEIVLAS